MNTTATTSTARAFTLDDILKAKEKIEAMPKGKWIDEPVFIIHQSMFDYWADREGQVFDGFMIHAVDRVAGTLRVGAQLLKVVELIPCEVGTIDRFQIITSPAEDMAQQNYTKQSPARETAIRRGAQWKQENNRHRRAW